MRVLCLHGMGTSGEIFATQTAAFRALLPPTYTFDFPDAPFPSSPAPGIDVIFPNENYYSFYTMPTAASVQGAMNWLDEYVAERGPFDAVLCFSQGCAVASSYLLYHQSKKRNATSSSSPAAAAAAATTTTTDSDDKAAGELPFKVAFFVCGGLVLDVLSDVGVEVSDEARATNKETARLLKARAGMLKDIVQDPTGAGWKPGVGLWDQTGDLVHSQTGGDSARHSAAAASSGPSSSSSAAAASAATEDHLENVYGLNMSDKAMGHVRIDIPTVHAYGKKDPRYPASLQLGFSCVKEKRQMFDHGGGHDIPRSAKTSRKMADLMEWLDEQRKEL